MIKGVGRSMLYRRESDENNGISYIEPQKLLCPERFYIAIKYKFVECMDKNWNSLFINKVYKEHLSAFSNGKFIEPGQEETKNSYQKYLDIFDALYKSIRDEGFNIEKSVIDVNENYVSLDGSHRIGIALYLNIRVPVMVKRAPAHIANWRYFYKQGMPIKDIEYIVRIYCKLKRDVYVICLWPKLLSCRKHTENAKEYINTKCKIVYEKSVEFTKLGLRNFLINVYRNKEWIGDLDNQFKGIETKQGGVWDDNGKVYFYIVQSESNKDVNDVKLFIRERAGLGNDSVHSTDNFEESMHLINILLNRNTIYLFNYFNPYKDINFINELRIFKKCIDGNHIDYDDVLIDSSAVMGLFLLRKVGDIDYLVRDGRNIKNNSCLDAENHIDDLLYHKKNIIDLMEDPDNYLYFDELKIVSLKQLKNFKQCRNSAKDQMDVKLINTVLQPNHAVTDFMRRKQILIVRDFKNAYIHLKSRIYDFVKNKKNDNIQNR